MSARCEGYRRYESIVFTLGPVRYEQCKNRATVQLKVTQKGELKEFPSCLTCWNEAMETRGIEVISARPIKGKAKR